MYQSRHLSLWLPQNKDPLSLRKGVMSLVFKTDKAQQWSLSLKCSIIYSKEHFSRYTGWLHWNNMYFTILHIFSSGRHGVLMSSGSTCLWIEQPGFWALNGGIMLCSWARHFTSRAVDSTHYLSREYFKLDIFSAFFVKKNWGQWWKKGRIQYSCEVVSHSHSLMEWNLIRSAQSLN